jgi:hypothetical protein
MNPKQILDSIYLGDRACKAVLIESWRRRVAIQVDVISRLKPGTEVWDFYADADIKDGWLVFTDVRNIRFEPAGPLPNDLINDVSVEALDSIGGQSSYLFALSVGSVDDRGYSTELVIHIEASGLHLQDPSRSGIEIMGQ